MVCKLYLNKDVFKHGYPGKGEGKPKRMGFGFSFSFSSKTTRCPLTCETFLAFVLSLLSVIKIILDYVDGKPSKVQILPKKVATGSVVCFIQNANVTSTKAKCLNVTPPLSTLSGRTVTGRVDSVSCWKCIYWLPRTCQALYWTSETSQCLKQIASLYSEAS